LYERAPDDSELAAFGLTAEDFAGDVVEIFPENVEPFNLFASLRTQWRTGANGPSGLDYHALWKKMDRMRLSDEEYDQMEADVQILESGALSEIHKPREK